MSNMSVPVAPSELNRQRLKALLDFYGVETVEELNAKDDPEFWKEKQWDSWRWNLREWGCYCQTFDMTQPKDGIYSLIDHYSGVRGFSRDETGEVYHEKRYQKATGEEHRRYALPKSENLLDDGMACLPEGPMAANLRLFAFPPTGHGSVFVKQIKWGAPFFGELVFQPNDQIRVAVFPFFSTPTTPDAKGALLRVNFFRDDVRAKPFSKSQHWMNDTGSAVIKEIDLEAAAKFVFPFPGQIAKGFAVAGHISNGLNATVTDGKVFTMDDLSEGEDSRFYLLQQTIVLNVVQLPQQGKPVAAKWRLLYRISKRLLVGVISFNGETLKQEPEMHEYSYE